jgi:hypothetical protein
VDAGGQHRQAEEHHAEQRAHDDEGLAGVLPCRLAERGDAVRDRLDTGDGSASGSERLEHHECGCAHQQTATLARSDLQHALDPRRRSLRESDRRLTHDADPNQQEHVDDEEVGGRREELARLLRAAQVAVGDEDHEQDRDPLLHRSQARDRGRQRVTPGGHRHGDRQHVIGEQRDAGHLGGEEAEVVTGDDVCASGRGVGLDRLAVRQDQEAEHHEQCEGDGRDERERGEADAGDEKHSEDFLRRVRARGQVVGGEHGECGGVAERLVLEAVAVQRWAEQPGF